MRCSITRLINPCDLEIRIKPTNILCIQIRGETTVYIGGDINEESFRQMTVVVPCLELLIIISTHHARRLVRLPICSLDVPTDVFKYWGRAEMFSFAKRRRGVDHGFTKVYLTFIRYDTE